MPQIKPHALANATLIPFSCMICCSLLCARCLICCSAVCPVPCAPCHICCFAFCYLAYPPFCCLPLPNLPHAMHRCFPCHLWHVSTPDLKEGRKAEWTRTLMKNYLFKIVFDELSVDMLHQIVRISSHWKLVLCYVLWPRQMQHSVCKPPWEKWFSDINLCCSDECQC